MKLEHWQDGIPAEVFDIQTNGFKYWLDGFPFIQTEEEQEEPQPPLPVRRRKILIRCN